MSSQFDTPSLRVYLVTDPQQPWARLQTVIAQGVQGGLSCVQLREKALDTRAFVAKARALQNLLAPLGVPLLINDRVDVALAVGAAGVHLGQSDMAVDDARRLLGADAVIGWSVETQAHVQASAALPVDYLGVSPVFDTPSKHDTAPAWGLSGLREVRRMTTLPLVAIGGIDTRNASAVVAAGADGLAVIRALSDADAPQAVAQALQAAFHTE